MDQYTKWTQDFLAGKRQRVVVNGEMSDWKEITSGVPQCSVLGPLLFVLFINDLPNCLRNGSEIFLYADDTKVFRNIKDTDDCRKLQEDLDELKRWTEEWQLKFHPEKCKSMRIGRSVTQDHVYTMYEDMEQVDKEKDIGVVIDNKLDFTEHLAEKVNKANNIVGLIRRSFVNLDSGILKA